MGILGAAAMTGMLGGGGGMGAAMMQPPQGASPGAVPAAPTARREVFCAKCSKKYPITNNFCPHCGNKYNPCPRCGSDNLEGSKRCVSCGSQLAQQLSSGGGFGDACSRCGAQVSAGTKFCPSCGNKIG
jgi:predicted amidophosphoribosyltransferase